jgi:hypothetical protein
MRRLAFKFDTLPDEVERRRHHGGFGFCTGTGAKVVENITKQL